MSARSVRRSFASPFVVTLAAAVPVAACYVQPAPVSSGGGDHRGTQATEPPPADTTTMANPPHPQGDPVRAEPTPVQSNTNAGVEQARPPVGVMANPPRPTKLQPTTTDRTWIVNRMGSTCTVRAPFSCPKAKPGVAAPSCNPPPPKAYACTPEIADGANVTIVLYANQTECQIQPAPMNCPPNAMCNPPPPQKIACPQ